MVKPAGTRHGASPEIVNSPGDLPSRSLATRFSIAAARSRVLQQLGASHAPAILPHREAFSSRGLTFSTLAIACRSLQIAV